VKLATAHRDRVVREALRRTFAGSRFEVLWHAADVAELQRGAQRDRPGLLLVELELLGDKAARLAGLIELGCSVAILSSSKTAATAYEAMGMGALSLLEPPSLDEHGELHGALRLLRKVERLAALVQPASGAPAPVAPRRGSQRPPLIAIGASTGGPLALAAVLQPLPATLPAALLIVQHIEGEFSSGLAQWLGSQCRLPVAVAERGETPLPGHVYVAGPKGHLVLLPSQQFGTLVAQPGELHVPAIDALFKSLAQNAAPGIAVLLTGMGDDGVEGLAALRRAGWRTLAQDERSSVVYGMPRAALERGAAQQSVALADMAATIERLLGRGAHA
jgi:two-component system response regulator WspF